MTALSQPWPDIIFAGQGSSLKIYDRASTQLIHYERIFASQAIHGFAFRKSADDASITLLAWGGRRHFACEVIREESSKSEVGYKIYVKKKTVVKTSDWIFDIAFQPEATSATARTWTAVLVNAHNEVFEVTGHSSSEGLSGASPSVTLQKLFSGPRCGLYSATLRWLSAEHVLIISGTAFGEIVVWSLTRSREIVEARRHYVFTGHEGSIFGVAVSDELRLPDGVKKRLLASCSDDRTIRVWDVSDLDSGLVLAKDDIRDSERDASRTTGFLNYVSEEAAAASSQLCLAVGMGHLSRIWDVRFAREEAEQASTDYICSIVSVGEDATCQKWHLINSGARFSLEHIASNAFHEGKNIWSMSVTRDSERLCILSGGADGKIVEHHSLSKSSPSQASHLQISEWDIERTLQALETTSDGQDMNAIHTIPRKGKADSFRSFAAIGTSQLLITTNEGLILLATCSSTGEWSWKQIAEFEGLKGYSVASHLVAEPFEYVFFGDARGNIYYYHSFFEGIKRLTSIDGKITKLIAEILPSRTNEYMSIVVTRHGGHPPLQLRIQLGTGGTIRLASTKEFAKWKPDSPQITSAVIATHESAEKGLIIGCRNGTIYSYSRLESSEKREFDSELPLSHGKEAVTAMSWLPDTTNRNMWNPSFGWLFSVGRDGTLAIHHFNGYYRDPVLVHRLTLSFGPNLEGIAIDPSTLDVSVWGFTSRYFMCQNVSAQQDTVTIECGGAHRIWNFAPFERSSDGQLGGLFAWIKAMKLNLAKVNGTSHKIIQYGGHGREIKSCVAASTSIRPNLGPLVATGAEDTNITISYFADWHAGQSQLKQIAVLRKHVTGVQSLHWSSDGHFLFSCGGFEEFYVWKLRPVPGVSIGIVCDSKCPLENADSELRITDFAVRDVVVRERSHLDDEQWVFLISMIYSDSSIKVSRSDISYFATADSDRSGSTRLQTRWCLIGRHGPSLRIRATPQRA